MIFIIESTQNNSENNWCHLFQFLKYQSDLDAQNHRLDTLQIWFYLLLSIYCTRAYDETKLLPTRFIFMAFLLRFLIYRISFFSFERNV